MVRKSAKCGVRSGNTYRASNSRYLRQYALQSGLVRLVKDVPGDPTGDGIPVSNVLKELGMTGHNVIYSLNKKGRWALPALLKDEILGGDHSEEMFKVSLIERHKLKREANCISFCASKGVIRQVGRKTKKTYFNGKSLLNSRPGGQQGQRRRRRSKRAALHNVALDPSEAVEQVPDPDVRYEVLYPSPMSCSITHNPKYIRNKAVVIDGEIEQRSQNRSKVKSKCRRNQVKFDNGGGKLYETENVEWNWDDFCEENDESDDIFSDSEKNRNVEESYDILLEDLIESAMKAKELCDDGMKRNQKASRHSFQECTTDYKGTVVFVDSYQPRRLMPRFKKNKPGTNRSNRSPRKKQTNTDNVTTEIHSPELEKFLQTKMEPVRVIIPSEDASVSRLSNEFGANFAECDCLPRKFIINLTDRVCSIVKGTKIFPANFYRLMDMSTFLVFEYDGEYDAGLDIFNVYINIKANVESLKIHTLFDLVTCSVDEVISRSIVFLETLPLDCFVKKSDIDTCRQTRPALVTFENILALNKWNMVTYDPNCSYPSDVMRLRSPEVGGISTRCQDKDTEPKCLITPPEYCNICFQSIELTNADGSPATALTTCGHWFCNSCWRDHLECRVSGGQLTLTCPEYECDTVLDLGTALTLLNIGHIERFAKRVQETDIERSDDTKWCPNPKCGRIIRASGIKHNDSPVNVTCACGKEVCFACLKPAHWPVSCDNARYYVKALRTNGDDISVMEDAEAIVQGKKCPHCKRFIEKNGGCHYMTCICGASFCWGCGKKNSNDSHDNCHRKSDVAGTKKVFIHRRDAVVQFSDGKERTRYYQIALKHRWARQPKDTKALKNAAKQLGFRLRDLNAKRGDVIGQELEGFNYGTETNTVQDIKDKIPIFLNCMVSLTIELHHVIEHTSVLLDKGTPRRPKKLVCIFERMEFLVQSITDVFNAGLNQDLKNVVRGLWMLRKFAKENMKALVNNLSES